MEKNTANWIVFYNRHGEEMNLPFYFVGRPTLSNVVSKIRKQPQLIDFVLPYTPPGMTPDAKANAFLFVNEIDGLVFTPYVDIEGRPRS